MNNYKELSFLISSLFVIYFFKDIITTLIILVILSSISMLLMKADFEKANINLEKVPRSNNGLNTDVAQTYTPPENNYKKEQYSTQQNPNNFVRSPNFVYNR